MTDLAMPDNYFGFHCASNKSPQIKILTIWHVPQMNKLCIWPERSFPFTVWSVIHHVTNLAPVTFQPTKECYPCMTFKKKILRVVLVTLSLEANSISDHHTKVKAISAT